MNKHKIYDVAVPTAWGEGNMQKSIKGTSHVVSSGRLIIRDGTVEVFTAAPGQWSWLQVGEDQDYD